LDTDGFRKMRYRPHIVAFVFDLYFKGLSARKIVDHLDQFGFLKIHHTTALRWIQKYVKIMKAYVGEMKPQVSEIWHADEMVLNVNGRYRWLWNLMDRETRFLLAAQLTGQRAAEDAARLFHEARLNAGKRPEVIVTDGLQVYRDAYTKEFRTPKKDRTEHARLAKLGDKTGQNLIERLNGTIRERSKVMRALDTDGSAPTFVDGARIHYNFVRPHMGLGGQTPAEAAGMDLRFGRNRWLSLMIQAADATAVKA
jgi:transposase-like protein